MKILIKSKGCIVSEDIRAKTNKRMGKLEKFFPEEVICDVMFKSQKGRDIVEVTINNGGYVFRGEDSGYDFVSSIDKVATVLERQIRKNKTRLEKRLRDGAIRFAEDAFDITDEEDEFNVVRVKPVLVKPMSVEEAIMQMNLLNHEFFLFKNSESDSIDLVYKRKEGNYGLMTTKN